VVPKGGAALTAQRMAHLHPTAAKWHLNEFDQREDTLVRLEVGDHGNLSTRLVRAVDEGQALEHFAASIARIRAILPQAEVVVLSPAHVSFRRCGLEFAQARIASASAVRKFLFMRSPENAYVLLLTFGSSATR